MRTSMWLVLASVFVLASMTSAEAKKGGILGGGNGHGPSWKNAPQTLPGTVPPIAPTHGHGWKGAVPGTMPPIAPSIANHGSIRSQEQHQLNAMHPTGQARARAEHLLSGAKGFFGKNSGAGIFGGRGGWGHGRGH